MEAIIEGLKYDTATATEIASDEYFDGSSSDRNGRNTYLYKTKKERFFVYRTTRWQGERNSIQPVSKDDAMSLYEELPEHPLSYEEAFGIVPEEA